MGYTIVKDGVIPATKNTLMEIHFSKLGIRLPLGVGGAIATHYVNKKLRSEDKNKSFYTGLAIGVIISGIIDIPDIIDSL